MLPEPQIPRGRGSRECIACWNSGGSRSNSVSGAWAAQGTARSGSAPGAQQPQQGGCGRGGGQAGGCCRHCGGWPPPLPGRAESGHCVNPAAGRRDALVVLRRAMSSGGGMFGIHAGGGGCRCCSGGFRARCRGCGTLGRTALLEIQSCGLNSSTQRQSKQTRIMNRTKRLGTRPMGGRKLIVLFSGRLPNK